jgi:hypothetical protein
MGIYDRDYMRQNHGPASRRGNLPPKGLSRRTWVVLGLVGLGIGVLILVSKRNPDGDVGVIGGQTGASAPGSIYPIDLNTATLKELLDVPGIGPATAEHIINHRPFEKMDDLRSIYGIGDSKLKLFSRYLTINPPVEPVQESDADGSGIPQ